MRIRLEIVDLYLFAVIAYLICLFVLIIKRKRNVSEHIVFLLGFTAAVLKLKPAFPMAFYVYEGTRDYRFLIPFKNIILSYDSARFWRIILMSLLLSVVLGFCMKYLFFADRFFQSFCRFAIVGLGADLVIIATRMLTNDSRPYETSCLFFDVLGFAVGYFMALFFKKTVLASIGQAKKRDKEKVFNDLYQD